MSRVLTLKFGSHDTPEEGLCLMEAVSFFAGEPHSDSPACTSPVLGAFGRSWNDGMRTDDERAQLAAWVPALVGTAGDEAADQRRAWMALGWAVRVSTPAWLDLAGLADHAEALRSLHEVDAATVEAARVPLDAARDAAWGAAWDAAGAAAGDAAWGAAWDAAGAAAWAAAGDAAGDAAWGAAWDAARAAAGDAAWAAAGAAAGDALEPTVSSLQASAHDLLGRMIAAGPHDPAALAQALTEVSA